MHSNRALLIAWLGVVWLGPIGCASPRAGPGLEAVVPQGADDSITTEEYAVYSALFATLFSSHEITALTGEGARIDGVGPPIDQIVLADRTLDLRLFPYELHLGKEEIEDIQEIIDSDGSLSAPEMLNGCTPYLADAFRQANLRPARLDPCMLRAEGLEFHVVAQDQYRSPILPDAAGIYSRYPRSQGVTLLSRVGFSRDRTLAVVLDGTMRAPLYGHGFVYLLRKVKGEWRIIEMEEKWRS